MKLHPLIMVAKQLESSKKRRKIIRGNKKRKSDKDTLKEGKTYEAGGF